MPEPGNSRISSVIDWRSGCREPDRRGRLSTFAVALAAAMVCVAGLPDRGLADGGERAGASGHTGEQVRWDAIGDITVPDWPGGDLRRVAVSMPSGSAVRFVVDLADGRADTKVFVNLRVGRAMFQVRGDGVYRVRTFDIEGASATRVGHARHIERPDRTIIQFSPRLIGSPPNFTWMVESLRGTAPVDSLPDRGFARYRLPHVPIQVRAPGTLRPGATARITVLGFPPRSRVTLQLQPTRHRDGSSFGIALPGLHKTGPTGSRAVGFRVPRHYFACAGHGHCRPLPWRPGTRVDINVCTRGSGPLTCARQTVRIR